MALGGGNFLTQNKILPGAYINFISVARASVTLSDRGYATMPMELDWGVDSDVFAVTNDEFQKESMKIFGYDFTHDKLKSLRDIFKNIHTLYCYRLNSNGDKAICKFCKAKYSGIRGNDIKIIIEQNLDNPLLFDVETILEEKIIDRQSVADIKGLKNNDYVDWDNNTVLEATAGTSLTGGVNGTLHNSNHQDYLDAIESYAFNCMGVSTTDDTIKSLYEMFTKRMRDEIGAKFQCVLFNQKSDFEGIVNVKNNVEIVPWVTGLLAGCPVNKSCLNKQYTGEFDVDCNYTQTQLIKAIENGEFTLHKVGDEVRVLMDINSLVTQTDTKGNIFKENQTIRVCDQIAIDIANIFNTKYLGNVANDEEGRISFKSEIVKHHNELMKLRAIENFKDTDVFVYQGDTKKAVLVNDYISVINAMGQLYMTVKVA